MTVARRGVTVALVSVGSGTVMVLTSGLTVALPSIRAAFGGSASAAAWVLAAYTLAFAMSSLSGGALGDRFGPRPVFAAGCGLMAAGSVPAAGAPALPLVILGTFVQGVGAALVLPTAVQCIHRIHASDPQARARALGLWAGTNALGAATGPVLCGALVAGPGWRQLFVVVAAISLATAAIAWRLVPRYPGTPARTDVAGQVVMVLVLGLAVVLAHELEQLTWRTGLAGLALLALGTGAFWRIESRTTTALLPVEVLRDRAFGANAAATIVGTGAFFGTVYVIGVELQESLHVSAFHAGLALLPMAAGNVASAMVAGRLMARFGVRRAGIAGAGLLAVALIPLPFAYADRVALSALLALLGAGWGLLVPTTSMAALHRAPVGKHGVAGGVTAGGRELGAALAASLLILDAPAGLAVAAAAGIAALAITVAWVRQVDHPAVTVQPRATATS